MRCLLQSARKWGTGVSLGEQSPVPRIFVVGTDSLLQLSCLLLLPQTEVSMA